MIEKTDKYGGNTAMSGGVIWVPNSHLMAAKGLKDSAEKGFDYLKHLIGGCGSKNNCNYFTIQYFKK